MFLIYYFNIILNPIKHLIKKMKNNRKSSLSSEKKSKKTTVNQHLKVIRKFHSVYEGISGKTFIVEKEYEYQTTIEYRMKFVNIEIIKMYAALISIFCGIYYYEFTFDQDKIEIVKNKHITLLYFNMCLTLILLFAIYCHEKMEIQYKKYLKKVNSDENIIKNGSYKKFLVGLLLIVTTPSHWYIGLSVKESNKDLNFEANYSVNSIMVVVSLVRIIFVIRPILIVNLFMDPLSNFKCRQYSFETSLMYSLKCQTKYSPLQTYSMFLLLFLLALSYALRLFERPANNYFDNYIDSIWFNFATMTTVGYGEVSALTWAGRIICVISCFTGVFLLSMVIATVTNILSLEPHEMRMLAILNKSINIEEKKAQAANVIGNYVSIIKKHYNGHNYEKIFNDYGIIKSLKESIRNLKNAETGSITINSQDFISLNNRLTYFNQLQEELKERRKNIQNKLLKLKIRLKEIKDKGLI